jgi:ferritin-like metal-binding protein YciE
VQQNDWRLQPPRRIAGPGKTFSAACEAAPFQASLASRLLNSGEASSVAQGGSALAASLQTVHKGVMATSLQHVAVGKHLKVGFSTKSTVRIANNQNHPEGVLDMKIKSLRDLFEIGLRYAYDCEQKLVKKGLPAMIEASDSPELRSALEQHLEETRNHVTRLERVFAVVGAEADTEDNDILDEMTSAAEDMIGDIDQSPLRDAALVVSGNQVEHYEMAVYGSLVAFARQLGLPDAANVLQETLQEEKAADAKLTAIGENLVNPEAGTGRRAA